jgi:hypothetical protein
LTTHVEPNSSAMCTTPLVSSSMNPAPRKNIVPLSRAVRTGANIISRTTDSTAMIAAPRTFTAGIDRALR